MLETAESPPSQNNWDTKIQQLKEVGDGLGKEIDQGIIETVAALNLSGVNTTASCEGHLDWGLPGPWVDVFSPTDTIEISKQSMNKFEEAETADKNNAPGKQVEALFEQAHALSQEARLPHLEEMRKLMTLLVEFYQDRKVPFDVQLSMERFGPGARLQNQGIEMQFIADEATRKAKLAEFQAEMKAFTEFLKAKLGKTTRS